MQYELVLTVLITLTFGVSGQIADVGQVIASAQSFLPGVRNVLSGILAIDKVHKKCLQRSLCESFSGPVVAERKVFDPVKRSSVSVKEVVQKEGRLRWIGDFLANLFQGIGRSFGIFQIYDLYESRRRIGAPLPFPVQFFFQTIDMFKQIPVNHMQHVMATIVDYTNIMDTEGSVYPFVRSATLGYGFGNSRSGKGTTVCHTMGKDCPESFWDHLRTANEDYKVKIGKISERNAMQKDEISKRSSSAGKDMDSNMWNFMEPKDFLSPRAFLCKTGRFLDYFVRRNLKKSDEVLRKETFMNKNYQESCEESDLQSLPQAFHSTLGSESGDCSQVTDTDAVVVTNTNLKNCKSRASANKESSSQITTHQGRNGRSNDEFPLLVFEGLPKVLSNQSEEDLVADFLSRTSNLSALAVRKAVRLPILQEGSMKTIVLVELDTPDHERQVLKDKNEAEGLRQIEVRKAKYQELWRYVTEMAIVSRISVEGMKNADNISYMKNETS